MRRENKHWKIKTFTPMPQQPWNEFFLDIADKVSERATCDRFHAGCVLVQDKRIISTGYNGSIPNTPHCDDVGHMMKDNHCIRTIHAEINAIANAARTGTSTLNATAYVTASPCWNCIKALASAGIKQIIYKTQYPNAETTWPSDIQANNHIINL